MKGHFEWKAAYFNVVSLVAIVFFLFAAVSAGHGLLRMIFPALSMAEYEWESVQSFSAYKRQYDGVRAKPVPAEEVGDTTGQMSEEELKAAWEEHRTLAVEGQRRRGMWNLLESLVTMAVAIPVLLFHRRQARRLKPESESNSIA